MENSCRFQSPIGCLEICEENGKLVRLHLLSEDEVKLESGKNVLFNRMPIQEKNGSSELLQETLRQLEEYFAGKRTAFDLPISCKGTEFQRKVWEELRRIPYGETRSYEEIAAAVGNRKAVRAVGMANHRNPILIINPCHRVIHKNGSIGGFACGMEVKRYLLDMEKARRRR